MKSKGIGVTVLCTSEGGHRPVIVCPEYAAKQLDPTNAVVERYIPAKAGSEFSIVVTNESFNDVSVVFYVDGQMANCLLCYAPPRVNSVTCFGVEPQPGRLRKFVFRKAVLTGCPPLPQRTLGVVLIVEDDVGRGANKGNVELGVIKVVVRRCIPLSYDAVATLMAFNSRSPVNEKSQKGLLDTRTELKPEEPYQNGPYANIEYLDNGNPFVEFRYMYKSMDLLEAMGIAPTAENTVAIPRLPQKRPADEMETERLREENKRLRAELARQQREDTVPLEADDSPPPPSRPIGRVRQRVRRRVIEVIDLTGD